MDPLMDPNEALEDIRKIARVLESHPHMSVRALAAAVTELDVWLSAGNAGPTSWAIGRARAERALKRRAP